MIKCPNCDTMKVNTIESRPSGSGEAVKRRRECSECKYRFSTKEIAEDALEGMLSLMIEREVKRTRSKEIAALKKEIAVHKKALGMICEMATARNGDQRVRQIDYWLNQARKSQ